MPIYRYKARDEKGRVIAGSMEVSGEEELQKRLESSGFFLVKFSLEKRRILEEDIFKRFLPITLRDKYTLTLQLANTVGTGVPLLVALRSISQGCRNKKLSDILKTVTEDLKGGSSFSEALRKYPKVFSKFYTSMVELGEATGNLPKILHSLAEFIKKEMEIRRRITFATIYPSVLVLIGTGLVVYILAYIMPQFIEIYEEEGVALPLPTQVLITLSNLLTRYWYLLLLFAGMLAGGYKLAGMNEKGRLYIDKLKLRLPAIGKVLKKICVKRFIDGLYLLYTSGLPILKALDIVKSIIGNKELEKVVEALWMHISVGKDLASYLALTDFFPPDIMAMIKTGEESGTLNVMLDKASSIYHDEVHYAIEGLISFFEMGIIIAMGIGVGFVAMAILYPIFRLGQTVIG